MELPSGTRDCEKCGKKMIAAWTGFLLLNRDDRAPPQYEWVWWCICGNRKDGGGEREAPRSIDPETQRSWHEAHAKDAEAQRRWDEANSEPEEAQPDPRLVKPHLGEPTTTAASRHLRMMYVKSEDMLTLFRAASAPAGSIQEFPVFEGVPADVELVAVDYSPEHQGFLFTVKHHSLPHVKPGERVPVAFARTRMVKRIVE